MPVEFFFFFLMFRVRQKWNNEELSMLEILTLVYGKSDFFGNLDASF